jgi:hypothetical protein
VTVDDGADDDADEWRRDDAAYDRSAERTPAEQDRDGAPQEACDPEGHDTRHRLSSPDLAELAGVEVGILARETPPHGIEANSSGSEGNRARGHQHPGDDPEHGVVGKELEQGGAASGQGEPRALAKRVL